MRRTVPGWCAYLLLALASHATALPSPVTGAAARSSDITVAAELSPASIRDLGTPGGERAALGIADWNYARGNYSVADRHYRDFLRTYPRAADRPAARLALGRCLSMQGRHAEALSIFEELLSDPHCQPLWLDATYASAMCLVNLRRFDEAQVRLTRLLSNTSMREDIREGTHFYLAESMYQSRSPAGAEEKFREFLGRFPVSHLCPQAHLRLGEILLSQGRLDEAVLAFQSAQGSTSVDLRAAAAFKRAAAFEHGRRYRDAAAAFKDIADGFPAHELGIRARFEAAWSIMEMGEYDRAGVLFADFSARFPTNTRALRSAYLSAVCAYDAGRYAKAYDLFERFISRRPAPELAAPALFWQAMCLARRAEYQSAAAVFNRLVRGYPRSSLAERADFMAAECLTRAGRIEAARNSYQSFIDKYPRSARVAEALLGLATATAQRGDFGRAYELFARVITEYPGGPAASRALFETGVSYARQGDYARSAQVLTGLLAGPIEDELRLQAEFQLGYARYRAGDYSGAQEWFTRLAEQPGPERDTVLYYLAWSQLRQGFMDQADRSYVRLITEIPASPLIAEAHLRRGDIARARGDAAGACALYALALERFPSSSIAPYALYAQGACFLRMGDREKAVQAWSRLGGESRLFSLSPELICAAADMLRSEGKRDSARQMYERTVRAFPPAGYQPAVLRLAEMDRQDGNYATAIARLRLAAVSTQDPGDAARARLEIGRVLVASREYRKAIDEFQQVAERYPDSDSAPPALEAAAQSRESLREFARARDISDRLVERYPRSPEAVRFLLVKGRSLDAAGESEEARGALRQAADAFQGEPSAEAQKLLGDMFYRAGQFKQSAIEYLKAAYLFREHERIAAEAQFMAGKACAAYRQIPEARNAYTRTQQFFPGSLWAAEAERCLDDLDGTGRNR